MTPDELVHRFLTSIGRPAEAERYLELFRAEEPERFALIAPSPDVARDAAGALAVDLRFLSRLGLTPVIAFSDAAAAEQVARRLPGIDARIAATEAIAVTARAGAIALVVAADLDALARELATHKVVFLRAQSGLQPHGGPVASLIDLTTEYDQLSAPGVLVPEQAELLSRAKQLIDAAPHTMTVAVTSPLDLLRELFTVRGAGTLIRRGSEIARHPDYASLDTGRLAELMHSAFGKRLRDGFFDRPVQAVYIADDYRGAAIVTGTPLGAYLTKFAVDMAARGEGVGRDLWGALVRDCPTLFWRARPDNPITPWYMQHCDGMERMFSWIVFWRGLTLDDIPAAIVHANDEPVDFGE